MADLIKPTELKRIADQIEEKKTQEALAHMRKAEQEQQALRQAFFERDIHPDVNERLSAAVRRAVEGGQSEIMILTFPSSWTSDRGRRINNLEPDWPASLEGFAKRAYEFYEKEMKAAGYKLRAQVLNYPDGVPGDIGIFLSW